MLTSTMKSVGEVMAIGGTFQEALGKAWRSLERTGFDLGWAAADDGEPGPLSVPGERQLHHVEAALRSGARSIEVAEASGIDPWFVDQIAQVVEEGGRARGRVVDELSETALRDAKRAGLSDRRLAALVGADERDVREENRARRPAGVQDGGHVCRRVPALTCPTRPTGRRTRSARPSARG